MHGLPGVGLLFHTVRSISGRNTPCDAGPTISFPQTALIPQPRRNLLRICTNQGQGSWSLLATWLLKAWLDVGCISLGRTLDIERGDVPPGRIYNCLQGAAHVVSGRGLRSNLQQARRRARMLGEAHTTSSALSLILSFLSTSAADVMARTNRFRQVVCAAAVRCKCPTSL